MTMRFRRSRDPRCIATHCCRTDRGPIGIWYCSMLRLWVAYRLTPDMRDIRHSLGAAGTRPELIRRLEGLAP